MSELNLLVTGVNDAKSLLHQQLVKQYSDVVKEVFSKTKSPKEHIQVDDVTIVAKRDGTIIAFYSKESYWLHFNN